MRSVWKVREHARYSDQIKPYQMCKFYNVLFVILERQFNYEYIVNNSYFRVTVEARFNIKRKVPGSRKALLALGHRQGVELDILMATAA